MRRRIPRKPTRREVKAALEVYRPLQQLPLPPAPPIPRPLQPGEFFCHKCNSFVMLVDHELHSKKHLSMVPKL